MIEVPFDVPKRAVSAYFHGIAFPLIAVIRIERCPITIDLLLSSLQTEAAIQGSNLFFRHGV
jgi:hypothetical protein